EFLWPSHEIGQCNSDGASRSTKTALQRCLASRSVGCRQSHGEAVNSLVGGPRRWRGSLRPFFQLAEPAPSGEAEENSHGKGAEADSRDQWRKHLSETAFGRHLRQYGC